MNRTALMEAETPGSQSSVGAVRLLLGGRDTRIEGFLNMDLHSGPLVDIQADVSDLSMFKNGTVDEIYASHILEHFSHRETIKVLREWCRVLKRGSKASISVPDFDAVIRVYRINGLVPWVVNILYGDQSYNLAFHYTAFTFASLAKILSDAGFSDVKRLQEMPYAINDCSALVDTSTKEPVSLHVEAIK